MQFVKRFYERMIRMKCTIFRSIPSSYIMYASTNSNTLYLFHCIIAVKMGSMKPEKIPSSEL